MERRELLKLAKRVLSLPTAPYHEHAVRAFVIAYCHELGLPVELDRAGNVIARYRHDRGKSPLIFAAHMDHPGFESLGANRAEFLGGVPRGMFDDAHVRFFTDGKIVRARVEHVDDTAWPKRKLVELKGGGGLRRGDFGTWDVPTFRVTTGKLYAAAIDDVLSVVVVLATLTEARRRKLKAHVWGVFTRAEEVGFHGAVELARSGKIPLSALVISMEMSRERSWARIGDGPVVRVGDRMTVFDPLATMFLQKVAKDCGIRAQRCLMDGGSCEASAFAAFGYRTGGLCLPLGNYHNIGPTGRPRAEYVSVSDLEDLLRLTVAVAKQWRNFGGTANHLRGWVDQIRRHAPRELRLDPTADSALGSRCGGGPR